MPLNWQIFEHNHCTILLCKFISQTFDFLAYVNHAHSNISMELNLKNAGTFFPQQTPIILRLKRSARTTFSRPRPRTRPVMVTTSRSRRGARLSSQNFRDRDRGQDLVIISRPRGETFPLIFQDRGRDFLLNIFETKGQTRNGHFLKIEG